MIDKGSEFFNRSIKSWLEKNAEDMYSAYNEGKSVVVVEKFIRILKYKIYKNMNWVSINVYIDKLYDIVNKYNNKYHNIIRMKLVDIKSNTYTDSSKEINNKNTKVNVDDNARISKYQIIFSKGFTPYWSEKCFAIKKVKNTFPWIYN